MMCIFQMLPNLDCFPFIFTDLDDTDIEYNPSDIVMASQDESSDEEQCRKLIGMAF